MPTHGVLMNKSADKNRMNLSELIISTSILSSPCRRPPYSKNLGKKQRPESIAKMLATKAAKKALNNKLCQD